MIAKQHTAAFATASRAAVLVFGLMLASQTPTWGQTSTPLDENRVDRAPATPSPAMENTSKDALPSAATEIETDDASAADIRGIDFLDTAIPEVVARAAEAFIGKPASRANLQALVQAMSEAYGRSDVALFTIVIPRQDLSNGHLRVRVAEGYLQQVILQGEVENRKMALIRTYADKLTKERPTSRRRLERYLSLIRDIPGLKTDARLELGQGTGAVRLVLKLDFEKPRVTFSFDNRTSRFVKDGQFEARARTFGVLREGDRTELTGLASINFHDLLYIGLSHSTPIGTEGGNFGFNYGHLETRPVRTIISGAADTLGFTYSYPVIRSYKRNLTTTLALDGVNSDNTAFGSTIATEKSRAVRLALGYVQTSPRSMLNGGVTVSKGLDILGAEIAGNTGRRDFLKFNARAGFNRAIGKRTVLRLNGSGQWTRDALPAVERFSVGGQQFGRAFENGLINADRGVAGVAEAAFRPIPSGRFGQTEIYGFLDYATVSLLTRPGFPRRLDFDLASAGGGIRLSYGEKMALGLEAANTIDTPYPTYNSEWRFSITWRLSLRP